MKRILVSILLTGALCVPAVAQQASDDCDFLRSHLLVDARYGVSLAESGGLTPHTISVSLGWKPVSKLGIYGKFDGTIGLGDDVRGYGQYYQSNSIGGGVTFQIAGSQSSFLPGLRTLDIHAACGTTVGNCAWKYTLYEAGLTFGIWNNNSPTFGIGYRLMDSRTDGIADHKGLFVSIGFRM